MAASGSTGPAAGGGRRGKWRRRARAWLAHHMDSPRRDLHITTPIAAAAAAAAPILRHRHAHARPTTNIAKLVTQGRPRDF